MGSNTGTIPLMNAPLLSQETPHKHTTAIALRMRARRKEAHLSQAQLSQMSGVSLGSLKRFEQTGEISLASLVALAESLECESDLQSLFAPEGIGDVRAALRVIEDYVDSRVG